MQNFSGYSRYHSTSYATPPGYNWKSYGIEKYKFSRKKKKHDAHASNVPAILGSTADDSYDRYVIHALTHARTSRTYERVDLCVLKRRNVGVLLHVAFRTDETR